MNPEIKQLIVKTAVQYLTDLVDRKRTPEKKHWGICDNLYPHCYVTIHDDHGHDDYSAVEAVLAPLLKAGFKTWPHFNGNWVYPIPDPEKILYPSVIYNHWALSVERVNPNGLSMFDQRTKYGRLRMDLIKHLKEHFTVALENQQ